METLQLPKEEFVPLSIKEICKPRIFEGNNNFTPPLKCSLIECKYYLYIEFIFLDILMKNKKVEIPFDLYDNKNDIKDKDIEKDNKEEELIDISDINDIGIGSINEMNDEDNDNDEIFRDFERESVRIRNDNNKLKNIKNIKNIIIKDNITNNINDNNNIINNKEYEGFVIFDDDDFMKSFKENKIKNKK